MSTITLSADFPYSTILFKWEKHVDRTQAGMGAVLNRNFGEVILSEDDLWLKLFEDPTTNHQELKSDAVELLRTWYAKAIFDVANENNLEFEWIHPEEQIDKTYKFKNSSFKIVGNDYNSHFSFKHKFNHLLRNRPKGTVASTHWTQHEVSIY